MPTLLILDDKFVISDSYDYLDIIKSIPGHNWSQSFKAWTFVPEYPTYENIIRQIPEINVTDEVHDWVNKYLKSRQQMNNTKNLLDIKLPIPLNDVLYPYQRVGVNYMVKYKRVMNADDIGCGKTIQSIAAIQLIGSNNILVVCPNSLKFTWEAEIHKWTDKSTTVLTGPRAKREALINSYKGGYLIINYESFKLFPVLWECEWEVTIFDEAHRIKNRKAQHTIACKYVRSEYLWALTGTPMENRPSELWSILNALYPKTFSSYWRFIDQHCIVNELSQDDKVVRIPGAASYPKKLHALISPIMLRRLKTDVLQDLPEKTYQTIPVELAPEERRTYNEVLKDMLTVIDDVVIATPIVITQYTRLKQICISKELLGTNRDNVHSAKLDALSDLVESCIELHKVVIFTASLEALRLVKDRLYRDLGLVCLEISGAITPVNRQLAEAQLRDDASRRVLVATIQAGATGLNLQSADVCIFLDKHPNPQLNIQGEGRLYRIGQKNNVTIYSIIAKDTIESYIENMLQKKEQQSNQVIDGTLKFMDKYYEILKRSWR